MRGSLALIGTLTLGLAGGCTGPDPVEAWQSSLEQYVSVEGHGDLNALRRTDRAPSESDFGLIGASRAGFPFIAPRRTDANAVLLGHRLIDDRHWYLYLVGMVEYRGSFVDWPLDDPRVTEIRLVALSEADGAVDWRVGESTLVALERYCLPQRQRWQRSDLTRAGSLDSPTVFPTDADVFELTVGAETMKVIDQHSKAEWTLRLIDDRAR